jgi:hypothetical protein
MIGRRLGKIIAKTLMLEPEGMPLLWLSLSTLKDFKSLESFGPSKLAEIERTFRDPEFHSLCCRLHEAGVRPTAISSAPAVNGTPLYEAVVDGLTFVN